jgi:hypothetical protein
MPYPNLDDYLTVPAIRLDLPPDLVWELRNLVTSHGSERLCRLVLDTIANAKESRGRDEVVDGMYDTRR